MNFDKKLIALAVALSLGQTVPVLAAVQLTLDESIKMALTNNESIIIGEKNVEQASWQLKQQRRAKGPRISFNSAAARIGGKYYEANNIRHNLYGDKNGYPAYNNEFTNQFQLQMPILNRQLDGQIKSSRYNLNSSDLNLENIKQTVKFQVIKGYYDLLLRQNQIDVAKSAADMSAERLALISEQYNEGTVAKSDLLTMEVELANYRQQLNSAVNEHHNAGETLNNLIGLPEGTIIEPREPLAYLPEPVALEECLAYGLAHRPDLVSALYAVRKAEADLSGTRAANDPTLTGNASQNYQGNGAFQQNHREDWTIGVNLNWTLYDNNQITARVNAAKAALEAAQNREQQLRRQIGMEISNAYEQLRTYEQNIKITELAMSQATENNMIAQVRYEEGVDTILNLTNAQEKLTRARTNYFSALYGYNLSKATLHKAMGVPVDLDATLYVAAEKAGKSSPEAVAAAKVAESVSTEAAIVDKPIAVTSSPNVVNSSGEDVAKEAAR